MRGFVFLKEGPMKPSQSLFSRSTILTLFVVNGLWVAAAGGSTEKVLYSFAGGSDGMFPTSALVGDKSGNLYGTTSEGGNSSGCGAFGVSSCGTVFQLAPSSGGWTESIIYSFTGGADGSTPYGGLVMDTNGNLYGTTSAGGTSG